MTAPVTFLILAYQPKTDMLTLLVDAVKDYPLILVDNTPGLKDQSFVHTTSFEGDITKIIHGKNLGFTGGVNAGLKRAVDEGSEWVVVLNDDLVMKKQSARDIATNVAQSKPAVIGQYAGKLDKHRWTTIYASRQRQIQESPEYLSGSCIAIHRDVIKKIGYFFEPYFMYYEDTDFCIRAHNAGFPLIHKPVDGIEHEDGLRMGKNSPLLNYYLARNHLLFVSRLAPLNVKLYETVRLAKTFFEHSAQGNTGGHAGVKDFLSRKFGECAYTFRSKNDKNSS